jgi:HSP20 family protein
MSRSAKPARKTQTAPEASPSLLSRLQDDLDRMETMFEGFWPARPRFPELAELRANAMRVPAVDVFEAGDDIVVKAEIPGLKKEEIEVNVTDSMLTVSGVKERKDEVREDKYYRCERSYGSFSRSVELPGEVQAGKAQATFSDGVLEVRLPKTEESKRKAVKLKIK